MFPVSAYRALHDKDWTPEHSWVVKYDESDKPWTLVIATIFILEKQTAVESKFRFPESPAQIFQNFFVSKFYFWKILSDLDRHFLPDGWGLGSSSGLGL